MLFALVFPSYYANAQVYRWHNYIDFTSGWMSSFAYGVHSDSLGNTFRVGGIQSQYTGSTNQANFNPLGTAQLYNFSGNYDALYLIKHDSLGTPLWNVVVHHATPNIFSGSHYMSGSDVTTDPQGNIYVVGTLRGGPYQMDSTTTVSSTIAGNNMNNRADMFLAKYDSSGTFQWIRVIPINTYYGALPKISIDSTGNFLFISSHFEGSSVNFDIDGTNANNLSSGVGPSIFLAKYEISNSTTPNTVSTVFSQKVLESTVTPTAFDWIDILNLRAMDLGENDNVFLAGAYKAAANYTCSNTSGTLTPTTNNRTDSFVASFNPNSGACRWINTVASSNNNGINDLAVGSSTDKGLYITGFLNNFGSSNHAVNFGGAITIIPSFGKIDSFLAKLNPDNGTFIFAEKFGTVGPHSTRESIGLDVMVVKNCNGMEDGVFLLQSYSGDMQVDPSGSAILPAPSADGHSRLGLVKYRSFAATLNYEWSAAIEENSGHLIGNGTNAERFIYSDHLAFAKSLIPGSNDVYVSITGDVITTQNNLSLDVSFDSNTSAIISNGITTTNPNLTIFPFITNHKFACDFSVANETSKEERVHFSPNPFQDQLRYSLPSEFEGFTFTIISLDGKVIKQGPLDQNGSIGNLEFLSSGVYLIKVESSKGKLVYTQKLSKLP